MLGGFKRVWCSWRAGGSGSRDGLAWSRGDGGRGSQERVGAIKRTGTGGRAYGRICRRAARVWYMASAWNRSAQVLKCCWSEGASGRRGWCRVDSQQCGAVQSSPARHFPDYAGDFCLARVGEVYRSRACVYEMRWASMYCTGCANYSRWCSWAKVGMLVWVVAEMAVERKAARQPAREQACLSERVGHEECAFESDDGKTRKRHSSHNGRAPTPTVPPAPLALCAVQG